VRSDDPQTVAILCSASFCAMHVTLPNWWSVIIPQSGRHVGALFGLANGIGIVGAMSSQGFVGVFADLQKARGFSGREQWDPIFDVYVVVLLLGAAAWWLYRFRPLEEPMAAEKSSDALVWESGGQMTDEHRMEQLSRAYVQAVAAVCGCNCARPEPDYGVDLTIRRVVKRRNQYEEAGLTLALHLKSTKVPTDLSDEDVSYDLDVRTYSQLRRTTRASPAILVLLLMPSECDEWLYHDESRLEIRRCAYWLSLRSQPPIPNSSTIRVKISRQNQFTPSQLERIMESIKRKEDL
jgi:uncharacterized protein DUF4365